MSLLQVHDGPSLGSLVAYLAGARFLKAAAESRPAYNLAGTLYQSPVGWLLLSVPAAFVRGVFEAMREPGVELPPADNGRILPAIAVMSPDDLAQIGGADKVNERGKQFHYSLGRYKTMDPGNWPDVSRVWYFTVHSPELQALRRSYGLSSLPHGGDHDFHVLCAVRRKGVLGRNDSRKSP